MPFTKDYDELVHEIFGEFGEGSRLMAPTSVVRGKNVKIGKKGAVVTKDVEPNTVVGGIPAKLIKRL